MTKKIKLLKILMMFCLLNLLIICINIYADNSNIDFDLIHKDLTAQKEVTVNQIETGKNQIEELIKTNQFEKAAEKVKELQELTSKLGNSEYVQNILDSLKSIELDLYRKWSIYLDAKAKSSLSNRQWEDSLNFAKASTEKLKEKNLNFPAIIEENNRIIEKSKDKISEKEFKEVTSIDNLIPHEKEEQFDIEKYFTLAEEYKKNKEYEKARDMLEKILILEPYNYRAMYELKLIYQQVSYTGDNRKYSQMKESLAQVEWAYSVPMKNKISDKDIIPVTEINSNATKLQKKLDNMIIPKVAFDGATMNSVLDFLRKETESLDKEDNIGINIDLRSQNPGIGERLVTLEMANVPLGELIRIICSIAKLNYKVEEHAIIISDQALDTMVLKYIPIKSDIINSIADINNNEVEESLDIESSAVDITSDENKTSITPVEITNDTIQAYFTQRGVPFPAGSAVTWDMPSSTLIVKNSPENLKILENLLEEIDFSPPLILIELKIVELTYNKNEGLAFNFKFNLSQAGWAMNDFPATSSSQPQLGNDFLNQTGSLLNLLEYSQDPISIGGATGAVDFIVYALEQTKLAETLSSPKIITKSGTTAYFEMVQKEYYATSWTVSDPEVVFNTVQLGYPTPNFEEMDLGIMLQVTATVGPNNQTIFLDVYPVVKEFLQYDNYSYSATQYLMSLDSTSVTDTQTFQRDLKMPQIIDRDIKSKLKVNDGDTVVLGGMLSDNTTKVQDKYPVLGDVPLLGRFFRSEYEVVEQKNLLFFVTAKLINPDGSLLHKPKPNGMFEFKNI